MKKYTLALVLTLLAAAVMAGPAIDHLQLTTEDRESEFPTIVFNGNDMGVAWMDGRDGNQEIYFRTANLDNKSRGPERRITSTANWDDRPRLCWTGSEFGLSWIYESRSKFNLMFATLDYSGSLKKGPTKLVNQAHLGKDTAICWTGSGYGVISSQYAGGQVADLVYRFIDANGRVQGDAVTITGGPGVKVPAALLKSGTDFFVVYLNSDTGNVRILSIDPFGRPRGEARQLNVAGSECKEPVAVVGKKSMMVAWSQLTSEGTQVIVAPLDSLGNQSRAPFPLTTPGNARPTVALATGRDGFGTAWIELSDEGRMLFFQELNKQGVQVGDPVRLSKPRPVRVMSNELDMAADSSGYVIAWVDVAPPMNSEVILSRVGFAADAVESAPKAPVPNEISPDETVPSEGKPQGSESKGSETKGSEAK